MRSLISFFFYGLIVIINSSLAEEAFMREPRFAGQFYPGEEKELRREINEILAKAKPPAIEEKVRGIIVPHAGYDFSGGVAGYAYKTIAGRNYKTVILLGPSHRANFAGFALYPKGKWKTPLGEVEVDEDLAERILKATPLAKELPSVHNHEHSLEVQIPFLQVVLKDFKILPIMMLFPTWEECKAFSAALASCVKDKDVLLLASTDLYHGYSYEECLATDKITLGYIERLDAKGLHHGLVSGKAQACGGFPVVLFLLTLKELGVEGVNLLKRTNSNEVTGERGGYCVGYASLAFYPKRAKEELTPAEKRELLRIARTTLEKHIRGEKLPEFAPLTERLKERRGVFVTLKKRGELRGCIGYIQGIEPLYKAVSKMTISSATEDSRFPPVQPGELKDIKIEITVLSPLRRIRDPKEIVIGKHGIYIRKGANSGLLLPQVAVENNWNREQFLSHTCRKAWLEPSAWKEKDTEIYIFSGEIFGE